MTTSSNEYMNNISGRSEVSNQSIQRMKHNSVDLIQPVYTAAPKWLVQDVAAQLPGGAPIEGSITPIPFFHLLERLKTTSRGGWPKFGLKNSESISDHMYRMAIMVMFAPKSLASSIDIQRCITMALVHDMAEALVGDITPIDGIPKVEKNRRESSTMDYLAENILGNVDGGKVASDLRSIWQEYEDGVTLESKYVHDIDKVELILQMLEYERANDCKCDLGELTWVTHRIVLPEIRNWAEIILNEREQLWGGQEHISYTPIGDSAAIEAQMLSKSHQHRGESNIRL